MKSYTYNGTPLQTNRTFRTDGGISHPANWSSVWTSEDFDRWGITVTELEDQPPAPPEPPSTVTPRQARMALATMGILGDVEAAVTAAGPLIRIRWDYALEVRIDDPNLVALAQSLGIEAQLPALFELASTL